MLLVRIAELDIDPSKIIAYQKLLAEEIEASVRLESGVLFLHAVSIKGDVGKVRVFECYANKAAYDHHITTPHFLAYKSKTADMVLSLKLIETDPIALMAKSGAISS